MKTKRRREPRRLMRPVRPEKYTAAPRTVSIFPSPLRSLDKKFRFMAAPSISSGSDIALRGGRERTLGQKQRRNSRARKITDQATKGVAAFRFVVKAHIRLHRATRACDLVWPTLRAEFCYRGAGGNEGTRGGRLWRGKLIPNAFWLFEGTKSKRLSRGVVDENGSGLAARLRPCVRPTGRALIKPQRPGHLSASKDPIPSCRREGWSEREREKLDRGRRGGPSPLSC